MTRRRIGLLAALLAAAGVAVAGRRRRGGQAAPAPEPPPSPAPAPAATTPPPPPAAARSTAVEGYCVKERKKVEIADPRAVKTKNGRDAIRGTCPDCGASIFRMGKLPGA